MSIKNLSDQQLLELAQQHEIGTNRSSSSLMHQLANSPVVNTILGAGDAARNDIANLINLVGRTNIKPVQSSQGGAYNLGDFLGHAATFLGGGEALEGARAASEGLPLAGKLAEMLGGSGASGVARRGLGAGAYGAVETPQDRGTGALEGAALSGAGELVPIGLKGIGKIAEQLNPKEYTQKIINFLTHKYNLGKEKAKSLYDPVVDRFKNYHLYKNLKNKEYTNIPTDDIKNYYSTALKKMHDDFLEKPTFGKAHKLQSQLGSHSASISKADAASLNAKHALNNARDALKNDMLSFLEVRNPERANQYKRASEIFKNEVAPYRDNKTISQLVKNEQKTISPTKLKNELIKLTEKEELNPDHPLNIAQENLSSRIDRGEALKNMGSIGTGITLGEVLVPGGAGALGGALAGKFVAPHLIKMAQNPEVINFLSKLKKPYQKSYQALLANILSGGQ